jgi:hypothetical protein
VPTCLAVAAGTGEVKNNQACAPCPERDTSSATGGPNRAGSLQVGQGVQHRGRPVEIRGQPPAAITIEQGVEPEIDVTGEVRGDDV